MATGTDKTFVAFQLVWKQFRLCEDFPPDFFDLAVIDECRRSGWVTWREILDHSAGAIHLGMTATPRRTDNVDTYACFCGGEPEVWADPDRRGRFLEDLYRASVHPEVLAEVMGREGADTFDLLAHLAFGAPVRTWDERAQAFRNRHQRFLQRYSPQAREVILALLEKYRVGGVEEIANPQVFRLPPFDQMRQIMGGQQRFGGTDGLRQAMCEVQRRLYA
jgi:type I site-specific restriction endonuclease